MSFKDIGKIGGRLPQEPVPAKGESWGGKGRMIGLPQPAFNR
jgi:hypothetical protein